MRSVIRLNGCIDLNKKGISLISIREIRDLMPGNVYGVKCIKFILP